MDSSRNASRRNKSARYLARIVGVAEQSANAGSTGLDFTNMRPSRDIPETNVDPATVKHFGQEWSRFRHDGGWSHGPQLKRVFEAYFDPLPASALNNNTVVGDFGAGSGRWARFVAPQVKQLYVLEPSTSAMSVARSNLADQPNVTFIEETIGGPSMPRGELDVAYSLGVIHHIPDSLRALRHVRASLKPCGLFLGYLYYALDNRPSWYRALWRLSDHVRSIVSRLPERRKRFVTDIVAAVIYWPLARMARLIEIIGGRSTLIPLRQYADKNFYVMRNDALDRFGTPLEQRFSRVQITKMLSDAGFDVSTLVFSDREPFWCFSVANSVEGAR